MSEDGTVTGRDEQMRPVFTCVMCGCVYLPPKTMQYPQLATKASSLHCGAAQCRRACAALPAPVTSVLAKTAWEQARQWMNRELSMLPERGRRRTGGRVRPGGNRSKLR
ncbi:hypothetical protein AB0F13_20575 [Streptomyces sp. NPDC026206]|uniref:hypothetical protein n=1 Tax=Streptomyces sp. NPDC026206 TaxID=3157089 RepID=UPI0033CF2594